VNRKEGTGVSKRRDGRSRAVAAIIGAACAAALVAFVLLATSAGGNNGGYAVRAIFDDSGNIIPGENVEIDGVKAGTVKAVEPTPQAKAAVVLSISNPGFRDFRADASCRIRPQGLIGEMYADCAPTQPRVEGTPLPPALKRIPSGQEGAGQYLLPLSNTSSPVNSDLLGDITRLPERERFTIILNELGAGLAGRGSDLNAVVRRANPALQELDKVLHILASENTVLAELAENSDKALAPFAKVRGRVADFIAQSNTLARATARHLPALAQNLKDFPPFLEQLGPAMERLGHFAEETRPVFTNLGIAAPGIDKAFTNLPGFSKSSESYFESLGSTAKVSGPALVGIKPLLQRLKNLGSAGKPFAGNAAQLLTSLRETGGIERLLDFIFLGTGASNGYDALGHFLRTEGLGTACLAYKIQIEEKCNRHLFSTGSPSASSASTASASSASGSSGTFAEQLALAPKPNVSTQGLVMARTLAVIEGDTPEQANAQYPGSEGEGARTEGAHASAASRSSSNAAGGASAGSPASGQADQLLLNYLLGSE
jgi:ABC-type transporter Mla subunit MlaD